MAFEIGPVGKAALAGNGALGVFKGELGLENRGVGGDVEFGEGCRRRNAARGSAALWALSRSLACFLSCSIFGAGAGIEHSFRNAWCPRRSGREKSVMAVLLSRKQRRAQPFSRTRGFPL